MNGNKQVVSRRVHKGSGEIRPNGQKDTVHTKSEETEHFGALDTAKEIDRPTSDPLSGPLLC